MECRLANESGEEAWKSKSASNPAVPYKRSIKTIKTIKNYGQILQSPDE